MNGYFNESIRLQFRTHIGRQIDKQFYDQLRTQISSQLYDNSLFHRLSSQLREQLENTI